MAALGILFAIASSPSGSDVGGLIGVTVAYGQTGLNNVHATGAVTVVGAGATDVGGLIGDALAQGVPAPPRA